MSVSTHQLFRGWRIGVLGLAFTLLAVLAGQWIHVCSVILFPGAMIVIFLLPLVGFDGSKHGLTSFCVMIAIDTLIYSVAFALFLRLLGLIVKQVRRV